MEKEFTDKLAIEVEKFLVKRGGIWKYEGIGPHVLLTSGMHSGWFFDISYAICEDPRGAEFLAELLVRKLKKEIGDLLSKATRVVSSAMAGIILGHEVAKKLGIKFAYCDKEGNDQVLKRVSLKDNEVILQIEELITTLSTTQKVTRAILRNNPKVEILQRNGKIIVGTIIHRPPEFKENPDYEIIALWQKEIQSYHPEECPMCKQGSKALRFKENREKFFNNFIN